MFKIELKKGDRLSLSSPPTGIGGCKIVWEPAEPDYTLKPLPKSKSKHSVTTDYLKYIKEKIK